MSFLRRIVGRQATPQTDVGTGLARESAPSEELFSTAGDYGLRTLSESAEDMVEYVVCSTHLLL
jgi:hypothetical protein